MKRRENLCPICGNEIPIPKSMPEFQCKFCRRWVNVTKERKGKKTIITLTEV